jgi:hypothetical protein
MKIYHFNYFGSDSPPLEIPEGMAYNQQCEILKNWFDIDIESLRELENTLQMIAYYSFGSDELLNQMENIDNEYFMIHEALKKIKTGKCTDLKINISFIDVYPETLSIQNPEVINKILTILQTLPEGCPAEKKQKGGQKKQFYKDMHLQALDECEKFINENNLQFKKSGDKLFFCGVIMSLAGLEQTYFNFQENREKKENSSLLYEYKNTVNARLRKLKPE